MTQFVRIEIRMQERDDIISASNLLAEAVKALDTTVQTVPGNAAVVVARYTIRELSKKARGNAD